MQLSKQNLISGFSMVAIGLILYSQTFGLEDAFLSEGIHPMDYPRVLIYILIAVGLIIAFKPSASSCAQGDGIAIFSLRSCGIGAAMLVYALIFDVVGFAISSLLISCACAWIMGWRNLKVMLITNVLGVAIIWALFRYILKIPLPTGMLF